MKKYPSMKILATEALSFLSSYSLNITVICLSHLAVAPGGHPLNRSCAKFGHDKPASIHQGSYRSGCFLKINATESSLVNDSE